VLSGVELVSVRPWLSRPRSPSGCVAGVEGWFLGPVWKLVKKDSAGW